MIMLNMMIVLIMLVIIVIHVVLTIIQQQPRRFLTDELLELSYGTIPIF